MPDLKAEAQYSINFWRWNREICLSVHYKYKGFSSLEISASKSTIWESS